MAKALPKGFIVGRSCYALEISVPGAGARRCDVFTYAKKEQIRACLEFEFNDADRERLEGVGGLALDAGETLVVWTIQEGELASALALHPHIFISLDRKAPRPRRPGGADLYSRLAAVAELPLPPGDAPYDCLDAGDIERWIHFRVDWSAIEPQIPTLRGQRLRAGEKLAFRPNRTVSRPFGRRSWVCDKDDRDWHFVRYGHYDGDGFGWSQGFRVPV